MDCYTFIAELTRHLAWPLSSVAMVLILRKSITSLVDKLEKAKYKDSEFEFRNQSAQKPTKLESTPVNIPIPTDSVGMQDQFENIIRKDLEHAQIQDPEEREKILISHLAATQLNAQYERINGVIFGSQIDLLRSLNSSAIPADASSLKLFYDDAARKYPEFYRVYPFEQYVEFLQSMGLIELSGDGYRITMRGRGYLVYIAERGLTGFRHY